MSDGAVGSISHILQTAFKDAYEEKQQLEESERRKERKRRREEEREAARLERQRLIDAGEIDPEDTEEPEKSVSEDEEEEGGGYHNPVDDIPLCEEYRSTLNERVENIEKDIKKKTQDAKELLSYLGTRRQQAIEEEAEEEDMLKKQGVMVGQHIPSLVSKLDIDSTVVNSFGEMSTKMIISRELLDKNKERNLRRTGNLPISQAAEERKAMRVKNKKNEEEDVAHFLQSTRANKERNLVISAKFSQTLEPYRTQRQQLTMSKSAEGKSSTKIPRRNYGQSAKEKERDQSVLKNINHRLNYLKAPRNDPSAVKKTLLRTHAKETDSVSTSHASSYHSPTSENDNSRSGSPVKTSSLSSSNNSGALFISEPSIVVFDAYEVGKCYTQNILFRNISSSSRTLRVIPPASPHFSMESLQYPSTSKGGLVAPGMSVRAELSFYPESLADYEDRLMVETEGGSYDVEIVAKRDPPILSLPPVIDIGNTLVGDAIRTSITCSNSGGKGSFKIVPNFESASLNDFDFNSCLRLPPYTIYPLEFTLDKGHSIDITLEFMPTTISKFERTIYVVGDNAHAVSVCLRAEGKQVETFVSEINSLPVPYELETQKDLFFQTSFVGSDNEQEFMVTNDTGIPLEYEWVWVDPDTSNVLRSGVEQLIRNGAGTKEFVTSGPASRDSSQSQKLMTAEENEVSVDDGSKELLLSTGFHIEGGGVSDHVYYEDFGISPRRGVLSANGSAPFVVSFKPQAVGTKSGKAVLMLHDVTHESVQGPDQLEYLENMENIGHGDFHRLRSWIEEIGVTLSIGITESVKEDSLEVGIQIHNIPSNRINLDTLIGLVRSHCKNADSDVLLRFQYVAGRFLSKAHRIVNRANIQLNDDDSVMLALDNNAIDEEDDVASNMVRADLIEWNGSVEQTPVRYPALEVEIPEDIPDLDSLKRGFLHIDDKDNATLRKMIWLDATSCINILGASLSGSLEALVNHDAIEFIQRCKRISLPALTMDVTGLGTAPSITFSPPRLNVGGELSIGKPWKGKVAFSNTSSMICEVEIVPSMLKWKSMVSPDNINVSLSTEHVVILPYETEYVEVTLVIDIVGKFDLILPVKAKYSSLRVDDIAISVTTVGPRIRFECPELDIGLVGTGFEAKKVMTFSNDTSIPLRYNLSCIMGASLGGFHPRSKPNMGHDNDSLSSVPSTARSTMTDMSVDSFNIDNPKASFLFDPAIGELGPHQSVQSTVTCVAGKFPERIRGVIECKISDSNQICDLPSQFLSIRGEIQTPLTILYPMTFDLGSVYVNTPVSFSIFLNNVSSLEAKYKFDRPGGDSSSYRLVFEDDMKSGSLLGREVREIKVEFTALNSGVIDDICGCKIYGSTKPLGFQLKAVAKGITVDFIPLVEGEAPPPPVAGPTDPQFPGGSEMLPEVCPLKPVEFGDAVDLYERVNRRFVIRNLSAMPAHFTIRPRKYDVGDGFDALSVDGNTKKKRGALVANEDGENRFHSEAGKKYIGSLLKRREDKKFLTLGLGACYVVEPAHGVVDPWGVFVVNVLARNDMPGCFDDDLLVDVKDHRRLNVPVRMNVLGCPLVIERDSFGMSRLKRPGQDSDVVDSLLPLMLEMGSASVNAEPLVREFRVRNNGSLPATLKWKLRSVQGKVNGPIKVEVKLSKTGKPRIKTSLLFWDDVSKDSPFSVDPKVTVVPAYGRKNFKVKMFRTTSKGEELALLSGAITLGGSGEEYLSDGATELSNSHTSNTRPSSPSGETTLTNSTTSAKSFSISLHLRAKLVLPALKIDEHIVESSPDRVVRVPPDHGIKLSSHAPLLFARGSDPTAVCTRVVTLMNPLSTALTFSVSIDGPFSVKSISDEEASGKNTSHHRDADSAVCTVNTAHTNTSPRSKSVAGSLVGASVQLLAHHSKRFLVSFTPKRELRTTMLNGASKGGIKGTPEVSRTGSITLSFSTGHQLFVPVSANLSTPFISASSPRMYFGTCHTKKSTDGLLLLSSPNDVLARWSVHHIPGAGGNRKVSSIRVKGFAPLPEQEDDPSVFEITPNSGVLQGPTVSATAAMHCPPNDVNRKQPVIEQRPVKTSWATMQLTMHDTLSERHNNSKDKEIDAIYPLPIVIKFKPAKNTRYSSRFRFSCEYGNNFDVLLEGQGTFEEHEHSPLSPHP